MVGYGGIGGLPQTRDLFTAPGSLLGADPYFQDIQRFQDGGFNDANPGGIPDYASLQATPDPDPDPYGAQKTADERAAAINVNVPGVGKVDLTGLARFGLTSLLPSPIGLAIGAVGAYQDITDANKMRAGIMPPEVYAPLGFWDSVRAAWPGWLGGSGYEGNLTDEDVAAMGAYGMGAGTGGDVGATLGSYNVTDPAGTNFGYGNVTTIGPVDTGTGMLVGKRLYSYKDWDYMTTEESRHRNMPVASRHRKPWTTPVRTEILPPTWTTPVRTERLPPLWTPPVRTENLPPLDRWADYQAARHGIAEAVDRAEAQKAAEEFAAWDPAAPDYGGYGGPGVGGDPSGGDFGFGGEDSPW